MAWHRNRENQFEIGGHKLAAGLYSWSESANYQTEETAYYDGDGNTEVDVSSVSRTITFQCHSKDEDEAMKFVKGLRNKTGDDLKTTFKWIDTDGTVENWEVTVLNIVITGGGANDKDGFQFQIHLDKLVTEPAA